MLIQNKFIEVTCPKCNGDGCDDCYNGKIIKTKAVSTKTHVVFDTLNNINNVRPEE